MVYMLKKILAILTEEKRKKTIVHACKPTIKPIKTFRKK